LLVNLIYIQKMKYNVKFSPEVRKDKAGNRIINNVPIFADLRFGGGRMFYFTGYRIDIDNFDTDTQQAKKNTTGREGSRPVQYNIINKRLTAIRATLDLHFANIDTTTKDEVKTLLNKVCSKSEKKAGQPDDLSFFGMFDKYINEKVSAASKKKIRSVLNHWRRYAEKRKYQITFDFVTVKILRDFEKYLRSESMRPKGAGKQLIKSPKGDNTIHSLMKGTRAFWNYAKEELKREGIEIKYPFAEGYSIPAETYGNPIYITTDERNLLFKAVLPTERLSRARDVFIFQCLIGARVGDMVKLKKYNIQNGVLSYIPRKTKEGKPVTVNVPLHAMAIEILNRYDIPDGSLLPFISDQRYNDYIKELFEVVGLTRIVTRLHPRTKEEEQVRLCDIASSHMARRAFVGNLYGKVDNGIISSMSGHVPGSKAFTRYYDVSSDLQVEAINKL